jgi:DNA-binding FadR family transcriptional regulator
MAGRTASDGATGPATGEVRRVADAVLERIIAGAYPRGLRLPAEVELASELGCGRSTVREALRELTGLGVVRSRRGSGAMVLDFRREGTPALLPWYVMAGRFDRPVADVARELLRMRVELSREAARLAARYATPGGLAEARRVLAAAPALARDPVAHAWNDLELFRELVVSSGIWPAVWLANAFWSPMRALLGRLAPAVGVARADYQEQMGRLLDLVEARDERRADRHLVAWWERVDASLLGQLEVVLGALEAPRAPARAGAGASRAKHGAEPRRAPGRAAQRAPAPKADENRKERDR